MFGGVGRSVLQVKIVEIVGSKILFDIFNSYHRYQN